MSGKNREQPEQKQSGDDAPESSPSGDSRHDGTPDARSAREDADALSPSVPDTVVFADKLRRIHRSRSRLMVCFYTLPLYIVALILLLNEGRSITLLMFVYMGVYAVFAIDMVLRECPRCGKQFFVNTLLLNFFARRCVHCRLPCRPDETGNRHNHGRHF